MNLLFSIGKYKDNTDATSKIAINIAREFSKDNECTLCFYDETIKQNEYYRIEDINIIRISLNKWIITKYNKYKNRNINKYIFFLLNPISTIVHYVVSRNECILYKEYSKKIEKICDDNRIDAIICFTMPFYHALALTKNGKINIPIIYYQTDPWGLHNLINYPKKNKRIIQELKVIKKSKHVFTTYQLFELYKEDEEYKKYIDKISPINFPNVIDYNGSYNNYELKNPKTYNICYLGTLDDKYRNPKKIVSFILTSKLDIKIHFFGKNKSIDILELKKKYNNRIELYGEVNSKIAESIMNSNVLLLNINNIMPNQTPSKIIDYISTGNPIINYVMSSEEESIQILDKYDNKYMFYEYLENDLGVFENFIINNNCYKLDKKYILKEYNKYTPKYVKDVLKKILID